MSCEGSREENEDETHAIRANGRGDDGPAEENGFIGGLYGGPGKDVIYGGDGDDLVIGAFDGGQRDELYCGEGRDEYLADGHDFASSSCEVRFR